MSPIFWGRVANRVAKRVAKQRWRPVPSQILRSLPFEAIGWWVHATLFATLMSKIVSTQNTRELQVHDKDCAD
jgi:hypothetical protein